MPPTVDKWPGLVWPYLWNWLTSARHGAVALQPHEWGYVALIVVVVGFLCMRGLASKSARM